MKQKRFKIIGKRKKPTLKKFHYTTWEKLQQIFESEEIRPATAFVDTTTERPAVFFSIDKQWELTANKSLKKDDGSIYLIRTTDEMIKYAGRLARIEIIPEAASYTWTDYVKLSGIDFNYAKRLEKIARDAGSNVNHFYVNFEPVKTDQWLNIQIMDNRKIWIDIDDYLKAPPEGI